MPIATLEDETVLGSMKVYVGTTTGPTSYTTGGFSVTLPIRPTYALVALTNDNTAYKISYSVSGNTITITVYQLSADTTTGAISAAEVAAGTDLSALTFMIIAVQATT